MAIRKTKYETNYTLVPNEVCNASLSWEARGVLLYLGSKPDDWVISTQDIINQTKGTRKHSKRDSVRAIIKELKDAGYLTKAQQRDSGKFSNVEYDMSFEPFTENPSTVSQKVGSTSRTDLPSPENPHLQSKENIQSKDLKNTIGSNELNRVDKSKKSYPDEFEHLWKSRPSRQGSNSKQNAFRACNARISEGFTWVQLGTALEGYTELMRLEGKLRTQYVMQVSSFFGTGEHYLNNWQEQIEAFHQHAQNHAQQNRNRYEDQAQQFNAHQFNPSQSQGQYQASESRAVQRIKRAMQERDNERARTQSRSLVAEDGRNLF